MSYSSSLTKLDLWLGAISDGPQLWVYNCASFGSTIPASNTQYFADGKARGMRLGDLVYIYGSSDGGTSRPFTLNIVSSIGSTGSAGLGLVPVLVSTA